MNTKNLPLWIRPKHAARLLKCGITTVYRYAENGLLARTILGRKVYVARADVESMLAGGIRQPKLGRPKCGKCEKSG